ncbi:MAG TPA: Rrf2 family transcriptional regulator [Microthrixaceae bacterium]|nr:Rrf2 family transcriptional regulator [Microthrixaceae bacterium]
MSAKIDCVVRALFELAAIEPDEVLSRQDLATAQAIPSRYLEAILGQLCQAGLVVATGGAAGGYRLTRPSPEITVAEVSRAVDGPLTLVQGRRRGEIDYVGNARHLGDLWVGMRAAVRSVMESVSIAR